MRNIGLIYLVVLFGYVGAVTAQTHVQTGTDADAALPYWQISDAGMSLRLIQRLPDQTRGYFLARGFSDADADLIARSCVFETIFKNISNHHRASAVTYNLHNWVVSVGGQHQGMKLREDWQKEWRQRKIPLAAQLAFKWSLYPTQQIYQAGDYNWGMSIFNLKPGTRFDLKVVWHQFGKTYTANIRNMQCAADTHPQPGSVH